jgi:transcription factor Pcc1
MILSVELEFECRGEREAASLEAVLRPDNHPLPRGQRITTTRDGGSLRITVTSSRAANCVSSVLSLLSDARLFAQVWSLAS